MEDKPMANMAEGTGVEADETSKGPPPEYMPESDITPLLATEQHPQPRGPGPFGTTHAHQSNVVVVTSQPTTTAVYRPEAPDWVGSDILIYVSVLTLLCCGLLPGIIALILSWEARNKKELGQIGEAKGYTIAAILCNVLSMLLGVGATIGVSLYYGIALSQHHYTSYYG